MKKENYKVFDLTKKRPNVLLLGNGLTWKSIPWHKLIKEIKMPDINMSNYIELNKDGEFDKFTVPNTILTAATSIIIDKERRNVYERVLPNKYSPNSYLKHLLSLPFDAILTTNYTYELESEIFPSYPSLSNETKRKYSFVTRADRDPVYLVHTYNSISSAPDIWHIHGELRRPSSIVLTHDEYAKHVRAITQYSSDRGTEYAKTQTAMKFKSWVDYILFGNVHILGLGMDYSEFDLWWLLNRRKREKAPTGKITFYEANKNEEISIKHQALKDIGVDVETLNLTIINSSDYSAFYEKSINTIEKDLIT